MTMPRVPFDRLLTQPYRYDLNNPPYCPNPRNFHPILAPYATQIAAVTANAVTEMATQGNSSAMIVYFNTISHNNWNTQLFEELLINASNFVGQKFATQGVMNEDILGSFDQAVRSMIIFHASYYVSQFRDFVMRLPANVQNGLANNATNYINIVNMGGAGAGSPHRHVQHPSTYAHGQAGVVAPTHAGAQAVGHAFASRVDQRRAKQTDIKFGGGLSSLKSRSTQETAKPEPEPSTSPHLMAGSAAIPITAKPSLGRRWGNGEEYKPTDVVQKEELNRDPVTKEPEGGYNVDRRLHAVVYGNRNIHTPELKEPVSRQLAREAQELKQYLQEDLTVLASPNHIFSSSLEEGLDEVKAKFQSTANKPNEFSITPIVVNVLKPIVASVSLERLFSDLSRATTFEKLAYILGEYAAKCENLPDDGQTVASLAVVREINRIISEPVQRFFKNFLEKNGFGFTGIVEDGGAIRDYVNSSYNGKYNNVFQAFQRLVCEMLFSSIRSETCTLPDLEENESIHHYNIIRLNYAIYYVPLTGNMLGNLLPKKANPEDNLRTIRRYEQSELSALFTQMDAVTSKHRIPTQYLLTADGELYQFIRCHDLDQGFRLFEV